MLQLRAQLSACFLFVSLIVCACLYGETLNVPRNFPTIKGAVAAARDGDIVEVEDGYYFEEGILLDKSIKIKAINTWRAVIYGSFIGSASKAIFLVRAPVEVEGFILKNGVSGILQRDSPDVAWTAQNLAILNMREGGISINAAEGNIGRGRFSGIIIDNCQTAFSTNDAYAMEVTNCLVANCHQAFGGYDHVFFQVDKVAVLNCPTVFAESQEPMASPRTNAISRGKDIIVYAPLLSSKMPKHPGALFPKDLFMGFGVPSNGTSPANIGAGIALAIAGDVFYRFKNYEGSVEFYEEAVRIGSGARSEEVLWRAHSGLARSYEQQGDLAGALEHYQKAVSVLDRMRDKLPLRIYNPGFFKDKVQIYIDLINLLYTLQQKDPSRGYVEDAFAFAERSKARGFLDSLEKIGLDFASSVNPDLRAEERRISREISHLQTQLQAQALSPRTKIELLAKLEEAENSYRDFFIRLRSKTPAYPDRSYPGPLGYAQVRQKLLGNDTALVEFVLGDYYSFAFLATDAKISLARLPPSQEILPLVQNYLKFLNLKGAKELKAEKGALKLNELLLGAFRSELEHGIKRIIVVPDSYLCYLPFESLMEKAESGHPGSSSPNQANRFLVEKYEFIYSPSASALVRLAERKKNTIRPMDLLAVAIPRLPKNCYLGFPGDFSELKYTAREIKSISRYFDHQKTSVLYDEQAEEGIFKGLSLRDYRFIHLATHGIIDDENVRKSGLLLWPDSGSTEDGFLQIRDIYKLDLCSDLVVLSACQTGKGNLDTGEGVVGLAGVFLFAGSNSVLVSLWNIADQSTAEFMGFFYRGLAKKKSVSQALRDAKIRMIRSKFKHPVYWAAFVLVGDAVPYSISK